MPELEDQLLDLAGAIEWPASPPHLWGGVSRRLTEGRHEAPWWQSRWALAASAVVVAAAALLAFPPSRDAIANFLNLHTTIQRVPQLSTPSPLPSGSAGRRLGLGTPTTLGEAQGKVKWHIGVPSSLGQPDEVYYDSGPSQGEVSLVYTARPGIKVAHETGVSVLITEARGTTQENFFGKMLGPDATWQTVSVGSHKGWWISGSPHEFVFVDPDGNYRTDTLRLATNTLIYDDNGTIVRIEADVTKDQALQIAASMS